MPLTRPLINNLNTNVEVFNDTLTVLHGNASVANSDIGLIMNRAGGLVSNAAFYWNESTQAFVTALTNDSGSAYANVSVLTYANLTTGSHTAANLITTNGVFWSNGNAYSSGSAVTTTTGFSTNPNTITSNVTINSGYNAQAIGPITVSPGGVLTVLAGQRVVIL